MPFGQRSVVVVVVVVVVRIYVVVAVAAFVRIGIAQRARHAIETSLLSSSIATQSSKK